MSRFILVLVFSIEENLNQDGMIALTHPKNNVFFLDVKAPTLV